MQALTLAVLVPSLQLLGLVACGKLVLTLLAATWIGGKIGAPVVLGTEMARPFPSWNVLLPLIGLIRPKLIS